MLPSENNMQQPAGPSGTNRYQRLLHQKITQHIYEQQAPAEYPDQYQEYQQYPQYTWPTADLQIQYAAPSQGNWYHQVASELYHPEYQAENSFTATPAAVFQQYYQPWEQMSYPSYPQPSLPFVTQPSYPPAAPPVTTNDGTAASLVSLPTLPENNSLLQEIVELIRNRSLQPHASATIAVFTAPPAQNEPASQEEDSQSDVDVADDYTNSAVSSPCDPQITRQKLAPRVLKRASAESDASNPSHAAKRNCGWITERDSQGRLPDCRRRR